MVNRLVSVDSGNLQFPDDVRDVVAANLGNPATPEGAAIGAAVFDLHAFAGATTQARLDAAIAYTSTLGVEAVIRVTEKLTLTTGLAWDLRYVSLDFCGNTIDASALGATTTAITVTNSANTGGESYERRAMSNFRLVGPGSGVAGTVGIKMVGTATHDVRGVTYTDGEISGFETGIHIGANAYLLTFSGVHVTQCVTGAYMPSGGTNYGENIRFFGGGFGSSGIAVQCDYSSGEFNFFGTSFDFLTGTVLLANDGRINCYGCHTEVGTSTAILTGPLFHTGTGTEAGISYFGGRIQVNNSTYFTAPTAFDCDNPNWGGGIRVVHTSIKGVTPPLGYLAGGANPLLVKVDRIAVEDGGGTGSGGGAVLLSAAHNLLIDGAFTGGDSGTALPDPYVMDADATTRYANPRCALTLVANKLHVNKTATGATTFNVFVPIEVGREYSTGFTVTATTAASGSFQVSEGFVAVQGASAAGVPTVVRSVYRSASTINFSGMSLPLERAYLSTSFNRFAPPWATHFVAQFVLGSMPVSTMDISRIIVTGR